MSASWFLTLGDLAILSALSCWSQTPPVESGGATQAKLTYGSLASEVVATTRELCVENILVRAFCFQVSDAREDRLVSMHTEILPLLRDSEKVGLCEATAVA